MVVLPAIAGKINAFAAPVCAEVVVVGGTELRDCDILVFADAAPVGVAIADVEMSVASDGKV